MNLDFEEIRSAVLRSKHKGEPLVHFAAQAEARRTETSLFSASGSNLNS